MRSRLSLHDPQPGSVPEVGAEVRMTTTFDDGGPLQKSRVAPEPATQVKELKDRLALSSQEQLARERHVGAETLKHRARLYAACEQLLLAGRNRMPLTK